MKNFEDISKSSNSKKVRKVPQMSLKFEWLHVTSSKSFEKFKKFKSSKNEMTGAVDKCPEYDIFEEVFESG
jgi:hypothetical protein